MLIHTCTYHRCMRINMHALIYLFTFIPTHVHSHAYTYTCTHVHTCTLICIQVWLHQAKAKGTRIRGCSSMKYRLTLQHILLALVLHFFLSFFSPVPRKFDSLTLTMRLSSALSTGWFCPSRLLSRPRLLVAAFRMGGHTYLLAVLHIPDL